MVTHGQNMHHLHPPKPVKSKKKQKKKTVDLTHVMQDSGVHHFGHLLVQFGHL